MQPDRTGPFQGMSLFPLTPLGPVVLFQEPNPTDEITEQIQEIPDALGKLYTDLVSFVPSLIAAMVIFFVGLYLSSLVSNLVQRTMVRKQASPQAMLLIRKISYWTTLTLFSIAALQQVGFNLTAFLTGVGIVGFTVGFALQDISKNFVSGLILLIQQPFSVGDAVEIAGFGGNITAIDMRSTEIVAFDGRVVAIPNGDILTRPIINYTRASQRRIELKVGVAYDSDLELVRRTAIDGVRSIIGVLDDPAPAVVYESFQDDRITFTLYYWIDTQQMDYLSGKDAGLTAVKLAFQAAGIKLPYPVQTVRLLPANGSQAVFEKGGLPKV